MIALIGTTIERNVTSSRMNASVSTNANTIGRFDFITSLKSFDPAVKPVTATSAPSSCPDRRRHHLVAQHRERALRRRVRAGAVDRERDRRDRLVGVDLDVDRLVQLPGRDRLALQVLDRRRRLGRRDVVGLDHDLTAGTPSPGNAASILSYACMTSRSRGRPVTPGLTVCIENAGIVSATSRPPATMTETSGRLSTRSRIALQTFDSPLVLWRRLATHGTRPFSVQPLRDRNESIAGSTVTRAEHRDADDEDRADAERDEHRVAGQEHARHRGHHGEAGDEHGAP